MAHLNYEGLKRYNEKIKEYVDDKTKKLNNIDVDELATKTDLATKADKTELFSGDYDDLTNKPIIPDTTNLASKADLTTHTGNTNIHVTSAEKNTWNNKLDNSALTGYATQSYVTNEINKATSGITVDLTPYAKKADVNVSLNTKVDKVVGKSLVDDAEIARLATINNYDDTDIKTSITNINSKLDTKANKSELFSGSYNDLTDKPAIPSLTGYAKLADIPDITGKADKTYVDTKLDTKANKSELFSKSYNDLTDKPTIPSLDGYAKTTDVNASLDTKVDKVNGKSLVSDAEIARLATINNYDDTDIKNTINNKANTTDLTAHTSDTDIHVTSNEKTKWDSKLDSNALTGYATETFVTTKITEAATSGKVDLTGYAKTVEVDNKLASKADKTEIPDISNLATKDELSTHTDNSSIHITASEKTAWNNKLDASALGAYTTTDDLNSALALKANKDELFSGDYDDLTNKPVIPDTSNFATKGQLDGHISNTATHVTADDKKKWNAKLDNTALTGYATKTYVTDEIAKAATSGTVDLSGYAKTADVNASLDTKVDKVDGKSLVSDAEITRLSKISNYDDTDIKTSITNINSKLDTKANKSELFSGSYNDLTDKPQIPSLTGYAKLTDIPDITGKANKTYVDTKLDTKANKSELFSGSYNDLTDKPTIPNVTGKADKTYVDTELAKKANKSELFSGSYDDLTDKPTIPSLTGYAKLTDIPDITGKANKAYVDSELAKKANKSELFSGSYNDLTDKPTIPSLDGYAKTADVNASLDTKVDKIDGKVLSTNDYTTEEKTKVGKIATSGDGSKFLANDGTYKKVSSGASAAVAERKFKPSFGFDTYWGEMRDNHGNKNQVDLETIKRQIDECEEMKVDRIICTIHIGWDETTNSLVIAENTDSISTAISYCAGKNVTIDTAKVHVHFPGTSKSEKDYINDVIGMSTFQTKYKAMITTICNLFKDTTVTRIIIMNEMWYITDAKYGYSSFINECLNIVKMSGYTTGLSMAGFATNLQLPDAVIQNIDTFYINVYPGISGFGSYITKSEAIEAFKQCDIDLWIEKTKKLYPNKKIVISEMGVDDYWENLAAPSTWYVNGTSKTGGHAVDTYITAMMEFFTNKNVDIEELWWWYNLYYEPVKDTLLNYLGGGR